MICPSCNAPNRDDAKFCKKCGQSFRVGARFTAPEAPEAPVGADLSRPSPIYRPVPTQETVNTADDRVSSTSLAATGGTGIADLVIYSITCSGTSRPA